MDNENAMTTDNTEKLVKHPRKSPITFVTAVFIVIFVYFLIQGARVLSRQGIRAYNVGMPGGDTVGTEYTGIILREEEICPCEYDGYLTFYSVDRERVRPETVLYSLDKDGRIEEKLHELYYGQNILTPESRLKVQQALRNASGQYDPMDFQSALSISADVRSTIFHALLKDGGEEFQKLLSESSLHTVSAEKSGFFVTWRDGYEGKTPEELSAADFTRTDYRKIITATGDYLRKGDFAYKLVDSNRFTVVFPISDRDSARFTGKKKLSIRLPDGVTATGDYSETKGTDGASFGVLSIPKYGASIMDRRYLSFQIMDSSIEGFKIPESAITRKSFFVVTTDYITVSGTRRGVIVRENGVDRFVEATVYLSDGSSDTELVIGTDTAYLYGETLTAGTTIVCTVTDEDGKHREETMTLSRTASCEGVYQINKGYCIFKPIVRLQNSIDTSYVIISSKVRSGIRSYDRIVLDVSDIGESEYIFE